MLDELCGYKAHQFTFPHIVADKARKNGDKLLLHFLPDGRKLTYMDAHLISNRIANNLLARGIGKGRHVAILMENSPELALLHLALGKIGTVSVPINNAARGHFLEYYLNHSDSTALVVDQEMLPNALAAEKRDRVTDIIVFSDVGPAVLPSSDPVARFTDLRGLMIGNDADPGIEVKFSDFCSIIYTSGTTGPSKGNMFTQINLLTFSAGYIGTFKYCADDIYYVGLPMFHMAALNGAFLTMMLVDGATALTRRFTVGDFWSDVRQSGATVTQLLSMGSFLLAQPEMANDADNTLRQLISVPMISQKAEFERRFGVKLTSAYGLTDHGCATSTELDWPEDKLASMGKPLPGVQIRIVDDDDNDVPIGEVGEILLRRDVLPYAVSLGYYNNPEATIAATLNLWYHSGDRGRCDADGYYYFADRKKDAIRRRGENISTFEVEAVISRHQAIADVAVYPVKTGVNEDEVGCSIVFREGQSTTQAELFEHCRLNMPYFMIPRFIDIRPELPRTLTQKVRKQEMKADMEAMLDTVWDSEREGLAVRRAPRKAVQV